MESPNWLKNNHITENTIHYLLPVVSKLIERIVFNQLYEYLNSNYLLTESQSGFRPMFSTETALLEMTNGWLWNIDNKHLNGVIFLDLKKAFDTMDHAILFRKASTPWGRLPFS